jgi:Prokaryotic Cytochrome C oxidase subunit IV
MGKLIHDRLLLIWALLVAVTLLSSQIGGAAGAARIGSGAVVTCAVLGIAFAKAGMVMVHFMELRHAPLWLRAAAGVWLLAALGALLAVYAGV